MTLGLALFKRNSTFLRPYSMSKLKGKLEMGNRLPLQGAKGQKGGSRIVKVPYKMTLALTKAKNVGNMSQSWHLKELTIYRFQRR